MNSISHKHTSYDGDAGPISVTCRGYPAPVIGLAVGDVEEITCHYTEIIQASIVHPMVPLDTCRSYPKMLLAKGYIVLRGIVSGQIDRCSLKISRKQNRA